MTSPAVPAPPTRVARLDAWLTARGLTRASQRDVLLAALVAVATAVVLPPVLLLGAAGDGAGVGPGVVVALTALSVGQCLPLALRRTHPVTCLLLVAAVQVAVVAVTPAESGVRGAAPLLAAYAAATVLPGRAAAGAVGLAVLVELVGSVAVTAPAGALGLGLAGVVGGALAYGASALAGSNVRTRRRYVEVVRRRALEAQASQEERLRSAVAGVRTRMAREIHDIAAHHLSGMVVQATAASRLVDRDPAAVKEGLLAIRAQGRRTLEDLRMLVGVLRDPATAEDGGPVPGLAVLDELVADARSLGTQVEVRREGRAAGLDPLADVTAYRLVQEALTNARQHAPGAPVVVELVGQEDRLVVAVTNEPGAERGGDPAGDRTTPGVGLLGMRERVQLVGGRLDTGPTAAGGWRVRAELPAGVGTDGDETEGETA
ncbi:sensor histidine kinase [Nocardioides sp. ChNu-153]|uniref:sensor histidine kinase n=1 Tax=unclassified Nocardioides TaxID=2615069 RepID=UPI0024074DBD|nr:MULTISPECIES: histidine kinase [unclassified Nocardioides]MDF9716702.1 hypothetical protein [Nocardioides sp. ChNu-99]MDN7121148.1 sensor histidine kinase [Nocardioides sp. ChNu-153]